jgi:hypothetical protein
MRYTWLCGLVLGALPLSAQAHEHYRFHVGLPLPVIRVGVPCVSVGPVCAPAPVYAAPVYAAPVCLAPVVEAPVVVESPVIYGPGVYFGGRGYYGHGYFHYRR